jgi:hypothetical protein
MPVIELRFLIYQIRGLYLLNYAKVYQGIQTSESFLDNPVEMGITDEK